MSGKLDETDLTHLRWMRRINPSGVGLYGPTILRQGSVPSCERLVELGLAKRRGGALPRKGYWITGEGHAALNPT